MLALLLAAGRLRAHGDLHGQIEDLSAQIRRSPSAALHLRRAELHRLHMDYAAARADYRRALKLEPALPEAQLGWGVMELQAGRPRGALSLLEAHLAARPGDPEGLWRRGQALFKLKRRAKAAADLAAAFRKHPAPTPDLALDWAQAAQGREALAAVAEAQKKLGRLPALEERGLELELELKDLEAALTRLDGMKAGMLEPQWRLRRAEAYAKVGRKKEAAEEAGKGIEAMGAVPESRRGAPMFVKLEAELKSYIALRD